MRIKLFPLLFAATLLLTACGGSVESTEITSSATPGLIFSTPTLAATSTSAPTNTPPPPTITPTFTPVSATLNAQINLRSAPAVDSDALGLLNFGTEVFIIGRSEDAEWLALREPLSNVNIGWVSVKFVSLSEDLISDLRVIETQATNTRPPSIASTTVPNTAITKAELNVRAGPASTYDLIGTIPVNTAVTINGKNQTEVWARVDFPSAEGGFGWVASVYLEGGNYGILPYYNNQGILISGQSPSVPNENPSSISEPSGTPANGFAPASIDDDSFDEPLIEVKFGPLGIKELELRNSVSSPSGDREDWARITPYQTEGAQGTLIAAIQCKGNGAITIQIFRQNTGQWENTPLTCGVYDFAIKATGGLPITLRMTADGSAGDIRLVDYTLTVRSE